MPELHWNLGWTLATLGLCWLALSCAVALALGQIIRRGKPQESPTERKSVGSSSAYADVAPSDDELADLQASRAASGTRLKPVRLTDEEAAPQRKVS